MAIPSALRGRLKLPAIAAPMFLVSGPDLVIACCKAGIVGAFPALNQRSSDGLNDWLARITAALAADDAPFAVNLIVHKTNPRLGADLELCLRYKVPLIITSLGAAAEVVDTVHGYGGLVFHDVTTGKHARKAAEAGVDGLILVAGGAGGHAGTTSPFALLAEVREFFTGAVVLAGSMSTGGDIAAAQMLGADFAYMGTRFIATTESMASPAYKQMLVDASVSDILYTAAISSIPASFLRPSIAAAGLDPDRLAAPDRIDLSHITEPYKKEPGEKDAPLPKAWRDIWSAGQGVASIRDILPAGELVQRLRSEYAARLREFNEASRSFITAT